jgi:signal transduction histidine kinase
LRRITKYIVIFFILSINCAPGHSESGVIDSLLQKLRDTTEAEKIDILLGLSRAYLDNSPENSLAYARAALNLAELLENKKGTADALNMVGNAEYFSRNYPVALDHFLNSLEISRETGYHEGILRSYNNLHLTYNQLGDRKLSTEFIRKAYNISLETGDEPNIARHSNVLGAIKSDMYDFDSAQIFFETALELYRNTGNMTGVASTLTNLGRMYHRLHIYGKAQEYYFQALHHFRDNGITDGMARVKNNIGIIHQELKNLDLALDYFNSSIELYGNQETNTGRIASVHNNIGNVWLEKKDYNRALQYYNQALECYEKSNFFEGIAAITHNIGVLHCKLGNYDESFESLTRSLEMNTSAGNRFNLANNYNNLGELFILQKEYGRALGYLEQGLELALMINARAVIGENYQFRSDIYKETLDYEKALFYRELVDTYNDSIFTADASERIAELQVRHKRESQLAELDILQKDLEIQQISLNKQRDLLTILGGIVLLTGLFILILFGLYRHQKRLNLILLQKSEQLETANEKLVKSEKTLQMQNASKDKFFSIIAHDLKNPFIALLGFSETLTQNYNDLTREQVFTYIEIINKSAVNLYRLLENLLEWSRTQTGNVLMKPEKLSLKQITGISIKPVIENAELKNIRVDIDISPDIVVYTDKNLISTVIRNIFSNAVKFTHASGRIILSAKRIDGYTEMSITDNGVGIEPGEMKKLFNLDYNSATTGTHNEKGTGLGLLLCREFVEKFGGRIHVESEPGKGSTFTFTIPG